MQPILFNLGPLAVASLGLFLVIATIVASFVIWRLSVYYDLNGEKTLDWVLLTALIGFISSRLYYILNHLSEFDSISKMLFFNRYPGLSFWGFLLGAILALKIFCNRFKLNFWQIADIAIVGFYVN